VSERLQGNVTKEVDAAIAVREETLQGLLEANQRGIDERAALAAQTQAVLSQIAACRQALRGSLAAKL
jgi:DNA-binding FrmR family transcriptional regulator